MVTRNPEISNANMGRIASRRHRASSQSTDSSRFRFLLVWQLAGYFQRQAASLSKLGHNRLSTVNFPEVHALEICCDFRVSEDAMKSAEMTGLWLGYKRVGNTHDIATYI